MSDQIEMKKPPRVGDSVFMRGPNAADIDNGKVLSVTSDGQQVMVLFGKRGRTALRVKGMVGRHGAWHIDKLRSR